MREHLVSEYYVILHEGFMLLFLCMQKSDASDFPVLLLRHELMDIKLPSKQCQFRFTDFSLK